MSRSTREQRTEKKLKYASARQRAEKKQREASFSATYLKLPPGVKLFKPKEGPMLLDILPFRAGTDNPCAEEGLLHYERTYHMHARIGADGGHSYLCPRLTAKEPCPICEHRQHLLKKSDPDDEKLIKDTAPKERQLFNVINLKEPDKGVQVWDMSYHLFGKLLDARIRNSDEEDGWDQFAALEGGLTLKVTFKEKSFAGRKFVEAETIDFKARAEDYGRDTLKEVHCLDELLITPDYDELKEAFLEAASPEDEDEDEPVRKKKPAEDDEDEDESPYGERGEARGRNHKSKDEDEDEDEDEEPAPKKKKAKPVDDEDEDDDPDDVEKSKQTDEDEDEDEEPAPRKKKPVDDDEEDEDEGDEDEPVKAKKKPGKKDWDDFDKDENEDEDDEPVKAKKKPAPAVEDEDDEEEDDRPVHRPKSKLAEDDEDEDEDEPPNARKPYKRPSRAKVKPEPEEDEDEDEDEEPPRIKSKKQVEDDDEDEDE